MAGAVGAVATTRRRCRRRRRLRSPRRAVGCAATCCRTAGVAAARSMPATALTTSLKNERNPRCATSAQRPPQRAPPSPRRHRDATEACTRSACLHATSAPEPSRRLATASRYTLQTPRALPLAEKKRRLGAASSDNQTRCVTTARRRAPASPRRLYQRLPVPPVRSANEIWSRPPLKHMRRWVPPKRRVLLRG
eukprot:123609-Chlamydomonas_euryale.AAC.1